MTAPYLDIERARFNMIEQQIRPWEVLDPSVLDLLATVKREDFVPPGYRDLAFVDTELPLTINGVPTGEVMLAPKVEARLLQALALHHGQQVLEIGTGSGYMAALLAAKAHHVTTVEINPALVAFARQNLQRHGFTHVRVEQGDGARGWHAKEAFDAIVISGGLPFLPQAFLSLLKPHGRLAALVGTGPAMQAQLVTRTGDQPTGDPSFSTVNLFETQVPYLHHAEQPSTFRF